ncbi:MAG: nuclear transport factor 2 family protein [Candidatus Kerfeldbacteria bacterium]|nr:nuclear transport factor 2 family protein [Candidatus Kerfeldbacteria bacterium]
MNPIQQEIWQTIQAMNKAWTIDNTPEQLNNYFHERMVAISATDRERHEGRAACVAAWTGFTRSAKIHYFKELDPKIEVYGNNQFAVVTYYFDMSFEMHGRTITMQGRDMFAVVKEDGKWWIVADQYSAYPL